MKSIGKFTYAAVLTLSAMNFAPSPASAQAAAGSFTIAHEVHWQNAVIPAGQYRFTIATDGAAEKLMLRKTSGSPESFLVLVTDVEAPQRSDISQLILVSRRSGSFVSTMQLPEFGMTLHFAVPDETR